MQKSESIAKLTEALVAAQSEYNLLLKESDNPFFKSKYADLAACIDAVRPALQKNGLAVSQLTDVLNDKPVLTSMLMHVSGEWIAGSYPIVASKQDPQGFGAGITYARRFSLCGLLGIAAEDDDGNTASKKHSEQQPEHKEPPQTNTPALPSFSLAEAKRLCERKEGSLSFEDLKTWIKTKYPDTVGLAAAVVFVKYEKEIREHIENNQLPF